MDTSNNPTATHTSRFFGPSANTSLLANRGPATGAIMNMGTRQTTTGNSNTHTNFHPTPASLAPYLDMALQQGGTEYPRPASELHEVVEMNKTMKELFDEDLRITSRFFPYGGEVVLHMLCGRVWGRNNGPPTFTPLEATEMIIYRGRFMTRQAVLEEVLTVIDLLAETMARNPDAEVDGHDDAEARLLDWVDQTSPENVSGLEAGPSMTRRERESQTEPASAVDDDHLQRTVSAPSMAPYGSRRRTRPLGYDSLYDVSQKDETSPSQTTASVATAFPGPSAMPAANAASASLHGGDQGAQTTHQGSQTTYQGAQASSANAPSPSQLQNPYAQQPAFMPTTMPPTYATAGPSMPQPYPFSAMGLPHFNQGVPFHGPQMPQFTGGFMPPMHQQHWPAGHPGYPYGQVQPQMPFMHPQAFVNPMAPPVHAAPRPRPALDLDPFPDALGSNITATTLAMAASSVTTSPAPVGAGSSRALPPAPNRQARLRLGSFNVAEWAQENRPPTPNAGQNSTTNTSRVRNNGPVPGLTTLGHRPGSDAMYPHPASGPSTQMQSLLGQGAPAYSTMANPMNMPFTQAANDSTPAQGGVMKIGNIPYGLTKAEVMAFLGKNAKVVTPDLGSPIHIIMDRLTGKTLDCYVEFFSVGDAQAAVNSKTRLGQIHKLGDRVAMVEMCSQDELLRQLFPKAKNVEWDQGWPVIVESNEPFNTGFKSFVTNEELVTLVKHAEFPQRSTYTSRCPQRTYESMISTLHKFPWYATNLITISHRNQLHSTLTSQIRTLVSLLKRSYPSSTSTNSSSYPATSSTTYQPPYMRAPTTYANTDPYNNLTTYNTFSNGRPPTWSATQGHTGLTPQLLEDLLYAGLNCKGFSERQKFELVRDAEMQDQVRISPLGKWWPFEVLQRGVGISEDVVEYYIDKLTSHLAPPANRPVSNIVNGVYMPPGTARNPFRSFSVPLLPKRLNSTIEEQGNHEMGYILQVFGFVLPKEVEGEDEDESEEGGVEMK